MFNIDKIIDENISGNTPAKPIPKQKRVFDVDEVKSVIIKPDPILSNIISDKKYNSSASPIRNSNTRAAKYIQTTSSAKPKTPVKVSVFDPNNFTDDTPKPVVRKKKSFLVNTDEYADTLTNNYTLIPRENWEDIPIGLLCRLVFKNNLMTLPCTVTSIDDDVISLIRRHAHTGPKFEGGFKFADIAYIYKYNNDMVNRAESYSEIDLPIALKPQTPMQSTQSTQTSQKTQSSTPSKSLQKQSSTPSELSGPSTPSKSSQIQNMPSKSSTQQDDTNVVNNMMSDEVEELRTKLNKLELLHTKHIGEIVARIKKIEAHINMPITPKASTSPRTK